MNCYQLVIALHCNVYSISISNVYCQYCKQTTQQTFQKILCTANYELRSVINFQTVEIAFNTVNHRLSPKNMWLYKMYWGEMDEFFWPSLVMKIVWRNRERSRRRQKRPASNCYRWAYSVYLLMHQRQLKCDFGLS